MSLSFSENFSNMDLSLVSVIIPSFNRAYCLPECIRSVLGQSGLELIVVNDGSTDNTDKVLDHARNRAKMLAEAGYTALALDMYGVYACCT